MGCWYLKKEWIDRDEGIAAVHIHYACTLPGREPDWLQLHYRLPMAGGMPPRGVPSPGPVQPLPPEGVIRSRNLKLPLVLWDGERREWTAQYLLHYYFEVFQTDRHWASEVFCDEIVYRDLEYIDWEGRLSGVCLLWSVGDWGAPVWMPTEEPRFLDTFGRDHERYANRLYRFADKPRFAMEKWNLLKQLPLPWRWTGRIMAPKGAIVRQRWHIGNLSSCMNWEDWDPHPPGDFVHFL